MSNQPETNKKTRTIPPQAEKEDYQVSLHGKSWNDPYFWLRNKEEERVTRYLEAENEYTNTIMNHTEDLQSSLFEEMKNRINEDDQTVPTKEDDYLYYSRTEKGKDYKIYCRRYQSMEAEEEIILDVNQLAERKEYTSIGSVKVSPNHEILAYSVDYSGYEKFELHLKEIDSGQSFEYTIDETGGAIEWHSDTSLYYDTKDDLNRSYRLNYHELHQQDNDMVVFEEPDTEFFLWFKKSTDKKYLFLDSHGRESDIINFINLEENPTKIISFNNQEDQIEYQIDHHNGYFYFLTSKNAINFRLCRTPVDQVSEDKWFELVPHRDDIYLTNLKIFKDFGILSYRDKGYAEFRVFSFPDFKDHTINLPENIHAINFGKNPNYHTEFFRFRYSSLITPWTDYDYYPGSKELKLQKQEEIHNYDPNNYTTSREFAYARDGTKIPLSIAYRKGTERPAPTLLYGYGSYGYSIDPSFVHTRVSLLERGIIYVIAHIRGGGELGKTWYHNGKLLKKENTFNDFIDAAKFLINVRYTTTEQLSIYGASAGGLLIGAVVNKKPEFWRSAVLRVPFVDVINTMMDDSIPLTTFEYLEWGNPNEKEYFEYIQNYSPYEQLGSTSSKYPDMLVMAGLNDPRVHYWEPAKFTAKLREIKTDDNRLILKTNMGAGHAGSSGRYKSMKETAFMYAYIIDSLELPLE